MTTRWATFDVYGTLIDWELGIAQAMAEVWPEADEPMLEHLLERFHEVEPEIEQDSAAPYREVLRDTLAKLAQDENLAVPVGMEFALADSLPSWPAFDEVPGKLAELHERGWKLGLLSNTDPDLLAESVKHLGITPDITITAAEAGSYKPAHGHWKAFYERTGADRHHHHHIHVAEGVFHDLAPCSELGITAVWINRLSEVTNYPRAAELENLNELPDVLDELAPPESADEG
ncbi:MAG TPA: HAD family hydrolase [Actinomycetota bacterium]|nr:HAD family hydrolase [Actinomycetota bacterium]